MTHCPPTVVQPAGTGRGANLQAPNSTKEVLPGGTTTVRWLPAATGPAATVSPDTHSVAFLAGCSSSSSTVTAPAGWSAIVPHGSLATPCSAVEHVSSTIWPHRVKQARLQPTVGELEHEAAARLRVDLPEDRDRRAVSQARVGHHHQ